MKYINKWLLIIVGFSALFLVACSGDKEESSASNNQVIETLWNFASVFNVS